MGLRYSDQHNSSIFFVTTTFNGWTPYGSVPGVYEAQVENLRIYSERYSAKLAGFVFMPTHLHLLILIDGNRLSAFMRDYKKYIAQRAFPGLGIAEKQIWMPRFDRVAISSESVFRVKLDYIHNNPVKAGLALTAEEWRWSSAGLYTGKRQPSVPFWGDWR